MSKVEIKGHKLPISILLNSLKNNSLASSYLFAGPEGIGKGLVAKYLAQVLNCQENNFEACGICPSCQKIQNLNHPDVHWINAGNFDVIKIEQVRRLSEEINLRPFEARRKVFIILDCDNLTEEAANCLLKTLEEPPLNSLIILTTPKIKKLLPTIISRCQRINFSALNTVTLKDILQKEYNLPEGASHYLSLSCEGRLGESLRLSQTNILMEKNRLIDGFLNATAANFAGENIFEDREKLKEFLTILMQWFRDIMFLKAGAMPSAIINIDRKNELLKLKDKYSFAEIIQALKDIIQANYLLKQNLNLKITLSLLKEKICKN